MNKEYKINIFRAGYILIPIASIYLGAASIYGVYTMARFHAAFYLILMSVGLLSIFIFLIFLSFLYFNKLTISIKDEDVIYKMPDKIIKFRIKDIIKIEKDFSFAGFGYYVFFYDSNRRKRHIKFTQDLEDSEGLIQFLQNKSGVKMRWEGTLSVNKEDWPIIKILKTIYNIFIVIFIIGALVVFPYLSAQYKH